MFIAAHLLKKTNYLAVKRVLELENAPSHRMLSLK
jgi:hypothetical protein